MSYIEVKELSVTANGISILRDVTFGVDRGEVVSIIGPNGSGKTTLIRAMLGLVEHRGLATLDGRPLSQQTSRVGYVPQRFDFDRTFPLSVKEFLELTALRPDAAWRQEVLCEFSVAPLLRQKLGTLSGGQMQRVLIAGALMKQPEVMILDEPTSGVDVEGVASFYELIRHINREHSITVLLISHEVNMVFTTSTKVVCLNKDLLCCGNPKQVITNETLAKLYGSDHELRMHDRRH
ncbi:MAG TPA: metal ABC transporter ATP-binding protein [Sedimentisphaerales bacterium]|nr:metal ABC transporter ATP-binding protein [Sedimentisphaerales bacterium]